MENHEHSWVSRWAVVDGKEKCVGASCMNCDAEREVTAEEAREVEKPIADPLLLREQAKYVRAYSHPGYRNVCHGLALWKQWRALFPDEPLPETLLDIGCGTGRMFEEACHYGVDAWGIDFVDAIDKGHSCAHKFIQANLWDLGMDFRNRMVPYDFGICADVLEHIPPEKVDAVLENICPLVRKILFKIANFRSTSDGDELHLTLQPAAWWMAKLAQYGTATRMEWMERAGVAEYVILFEQS